MLLCRSDKKTDSDSSDDDSEKSKLKHQLEGELPHTLCVCMYMLCTVHFPWKTVHVTHALGSFQCTCEVYY